MAGWCGVDRGLLVLAVRYEDHSCILHDNPLRWHANHRGDITGALDTILTDPPFGEGVDQAKVAVVADSSNHQELTTQAVLVILNSTRAADIPNAIKSLDADQQAHLMAYLYKVGEARRR